jgi:hypothetical protein
MVDDRKSSTMNSIFLGSTLEKPNVELIINAVATILHSQMLEVSTILSLCPIMVQMAIHMPFMEQRLADGC